MNIIDYSDFNESMLNDITPGNGLIVSGMPNEVYHNLDVISKSGLDLIDRSPAHYAYRSTYESTRALEIGTAVHSAVLEPDLFKQTYMLLKDVTDRRSSEYKQASKQMGGEYVLTGKEAVMVQMIQDSINMNYQAVKMLSSGRAELSIFARDPVTDVLVMCRLDWLSDDLTALDLKTTTDIRDFHKSCANYRYHVQQSFYCDVFEWATGQRLDAFKFLAVEKDLPCINRIFTLDTPSVDYGRKLYRQNLNEYAQCLKNDFWPMPSMDEETITLPHWAQDPELEVY